MIRNFSLPILLLWFSGFFMPQMVNAQKMQNADSIVAEGTKLYRSEMASWFGTDIFLEKCITQKTKASGYFSYVDSARATCVFYSRGDHPEALARIIFDTNFSVKTAVLDTISSELSAYEMDLYSIREKARQIIATDTMFKSYAKMQLNLVPIIDGTEKKVYAMTGPKENGVVVLGNDYLLRFTPDNQLISSRRLHANVLFFEYEKKPGDSQELSAAMHTHAPETGDLITATDIATLLLYSGFAGWDNHYVIAANYVSIWNNEKRSLVTLTREAWNKIYKKNN